jgi:hypothetical protein
VEHDKNKQINQQKQLEKEEIDRQEQEAVTV